MTASKLQTFKHSVGFFSILDNQQVYLKSYKNEPSSIRQFEAESEFYANYKGPTDNILWRIDECQVDNQRFHVFPAIDQDLVNYIGKIDPIQLINQIILPLLRAVESLHSKGWVHGDLKLENIRVGEDKHLSVFISDFGKVIQLGKHRPHRIGALSQHLAPDQTISPQLDIYALGVMAFQILFGFDFIKRFQMNGRSFSNFPEAKNVNQELLDFIFFATEPSAALRLKSAKHAIACLTKQDDSHKISLEKYNLDFYFESYLECLRLTFIESGRSSQDFDDLVGPFGEKYYYRLQKWQHDDSALLVHLKYGDEIVGICEAKSKTDHGIISTIMVTPNHQRKGFGLLLETAALDFFKKLKLQKCILNVTKTNEKAIAFYQKNGWSLDGPSSYAGAVQMSKVIN